MKLWMAAVFILLHGLAVAQDPWKNIYSQPAWATRDKWQRAADLIHMMSIAAGDRVADIGCHEGYMTFKLAKVVGTKGTIYAVDVETGKLEKVKKRAAQNNFSQIKTVKGDYDDPKLPLNSLEAVLILDAYHEMDAHDKILQHIKSSLKTGGRLILCEPIADERRNASRTEQERKHELDMRFATEDLRKAGFKIIFQKDKYIDRTKEKGDWMWVIVAEKD
jgi:ubiquinone/menaquinone biosynthesis C-methylase UbiE